ncbi:MAG TPA: hypothetical protein VHR86_08630 [Armatimonadota bacterium]|nr:hypothetical protein [Armatimonadota bacterium]
MLAGEGNAAPPVLYAYGNLTLLQRQTVALLSSGEESRAVLERTAALAGEYARAGMVLVAGHNRPGYRAAVAASKASGGGRVLVLDCGLARAFGGELDRDLGATARVWGYSFEPETTLALSPYPLPATFAGLQNRRRDRHVALLADRIIAVAIRCGGVMEGECRAARARGQMVLVYAGADALEGNHLLLADGFPPLDG